MRVGGPDCTQPYDMALLNVSAMSFGALSANAIRALNAGARAGGFAHDTGEGGLTEYHLEHGGDLDLGDRQRLLRRAHQERRLRRRRCSATRRRSDQIKCVSLKLSQGAKPGIGGVLPAAEGHEGDRRGAQRPAGPEMRQPARAQGVLHTARARRTSSPACASSPTASRPGSSSASATGTSCWRSARRWLEEQITPDFIVVDGSEGGTGAAPLEYEDHVGTPLTDGADHAAQRAGRHRPARAHQDRRQRQGGQRQRHRQAAHAGRRLHQRRPGDDAGRRLHPVAEVPHQRVPGRRGDPGPAPRTRPGRGRQGAAGARSTRRPPSRRRSR